MPDSYLGLSNWLVWIFSDNLDKILVLGPILPNVGFK